MAWAAAFSLGVISGCGDPFMPRASRNCGSSSDCLVGHICVDRICVAVVPGGSDTGGTQSPVGGSGGGFQPLSDAGTPAPPPPPDAGPMGEVDSSLAPDTGSPPVVPLTLTETSNRISVSEEGSFTIEFSASHSWQPTALYDRETDPSANLAGVPQAGPKHEVLMSPLGVLIGDWITLNEVQGGSVESEQPSPDEVVVTTLFTLARGSVSLAVRTEYRIRSGREVAVQMSASSASPITLGGYEFAFANLNPDHDWTAEPATDDQSFRFTASGGAPSIEFLLESSTRAAGVSTDLPQNLYFVRSRRRSGLRKLSVGAGVADPVLANGCR